MQGVDEVSRKLSQIQRKINDKKLRRKVMAPAARLVVKAARQKTKVGDRVHKRYSTRKVIKNRRAKRNTGNVVATYKPGNLRGSIARLLFRNTFREWIGPKIDSKVRSKIYGPGTRRFDGYYAQMRYGSAVNFRRRIMEPALTSVSSRVLTITRKQMRRVFAKEVAKRGLK